MTVFVYFSGICLELQILNLTQFITQIHTKLCRFMQIYAKNIENRKEGKMLKDAENSAFSRVLKI